MSAQPVASAVTGRMIALRRLDPAAAILMHRLAAQAPGGLEAAYLEATGDFAQTVRGITDGDLGITLQREGTNLRYAAIAALGLARLPEPAQREVLLGRTAGQIATLTARRAMRGVDPGALALAAWAMAEVNRDYADGLFRRMCRMLGSDQPLPTVDTAWMVTAAVAAAPLGDTARIIDLGVERLLGHHGSHGIFPHVVGPRQQRGWRSHIGCFADQVYPIQALARASALRDDAAWLEAADRTADRICELQGAAGQWWWHYDVRDGSVVEGYPVYSVHQHAMAPMVLFDLLDAGGRDHRTNIAAGVLWLRDHPEVSEDLVAESFGLVWRKVGRREPPKAARVLAAVSTSAHVGLHVPGIDRAFPPTRVDHECRPYELGWLLHTWLCPDTRPAEGDAS